MLEEVDAFQKRTVEDELDLETLDNRCVTAEQLIKDMPNMEEHLARMVEHQGISADNQRLTGELDEADALLRAMDETRQALLQE